LHYRAVIVIGARPNFMKAAPISTQLKRYDDIETILVHTGQHYDRELSKVFFDDLNLPKPDYYLGVGSGSHSEQSGQIMIEFERILQQLDPDIVLVVGDVNSTLACALAAAKFRCGRSQYTPVIAHIEAGLRSNDWRMPEEINRKLTDALSDLLFTTESSGQENLIKEGISSEKIYYVGNVMIDSLFNNREKADKSRIMQELNLKKDDYAVLTMHRPGNVDEKECLIDILDGLEEITRSINVIFPMHPRTKKMFDKYRIKTDFLQITPPLGYLDFIKILANAKFVLTDSGGIQEETTALNVPCLTLRENTERPVTVDQGTNILVGKDRDLIIEQSMKIIQGKGKQGQIPEFWDGKAAARICKIIFNYLKVHNLKNGS
jgi:UDP-N-acetylglucosamine 2-epimerase (non-hydrolysing)